MADARLDMEVVIDGTEKAAKGLDDVADSSNALRKASDVAGSDTDKLSAAVFNGLTRGASAANAAQSAMAQLMAGNFVGAFRSATVAVKGLWTAMWSNPFTAIMAGLALAASAVVIWSNRAKKAAEDSANAAREHLDVLRQIAEITGNDSLSRGLSAVSDNASNPGAIRAGIASGEARVGFWSAEAEKASNMVSNYAGEKNADSLKKYRDWTLEQLRESQEILNAWRDAEKNLSEAKGSKDKAVANLAPHGGTDEVDRLIRLQMSDAAESRARKDLDRKKAVDAEMDPIRKLKLQQSFLAEDMRLTDDLGRIKLEEQIYDLEKQITEERRKQKDAADEDAAARADAAKAEADAAKQRAAELRSIAGEKGDQWGPDVADGWKIVEDNRRRTLAGGRASQWFNERNKGRLALQGIGLSRTTDMGRPDIGADGKTNPAERTNQLLEKVVERLG